VRAFGVACEAKDRAEQRRLKLDALVKGFATTRRSPTSSLSTAAAPPSKRQEAGSSPVKGRQGRARPCDDAHDDAHHFQDAKDLLPCPGAPQQEGGRLAMQVSGGKVVLRTKDGGVDASLLRALQPSLSPSAHSLSHTHTQTECTASDHTSQRERERERERSAAPYELDTVPDSGAGGAQAAQAHERRSCSESAANGRGGDIAEGSSAQEPEDAPDSGQQAPGSATIAQGDLVEVGAGGGDMSPSSRQVAARANLKLDGTTAQCSTPAPGWWHKSVMAMQQRHMKRAAKRRALQVVGHVC
jgi:hypothetical protein